MSDSPAHTHETTGHSEDHAHHVGKHVRAYLVVGGLLLLFTGVTVFLSYVDFGSMETNIVVALVVATIKAGMVAFIFMHLNAEKWTIYRLLIVTMIFVIGLFFLTWLHFADPIHLPGV